MNRITTFCVLSLAFLISCQPKKNSHATVRPDSTATVYTPDHDTLPSPGKSHIQLSKVLGWPEGKTPVAPPGFVVTKFADSLKSVRWIYVAPSGDIFVSLANTESKGLGKVKDAISGQSKSQHRDKSPNSIILFKNGDPHKRTLFLSGLKQPFGMLVLGKYFYVANTDGLLRFPYEGNEAVMTKPGTQILELPRGGYNNHWTRNLLANASGTKIYITVGSGSNVAEHGMENEIRRANILEINPDGSGERIFASGLRNPVGMDWSPESQQLWTAVNERDELGDDLVPDYLTHVEDGGFYGWPFSYFGQNLDSRIKPEDQRPDLVSRALVPDVRLGSHTASLGLAFYDQKKFPVRYRNGAFVGQHGSWNRSKLAGYRVVFIPFSKGVPAGPVEDFLTGFIITEGKDEVYGRPVGVAVTPAGALLVADDAGDVIWKVDVAN